MLTAEELRERYTYRKSTGAFTYRQDRGRMKKGMRAGTVNGHGYWQLGIGGKFYKASRLAWLYVTGAWPEGQVDHKNRIRSDDRWSNLRDTSHAENQQNCKPLRINNKSGVRGVSWCNTRQRWQAHIQAGGKQRNLGVFKTIEAATVAYKAAEKVLHIKKGK
jgi:hypothetical protein